MVWDKETTIDMLREEMIVPGNTGKRCEPIAIVDIGEVVGKFFNKVERSGGHLEEFGSGDIPFWTEGPIGISLEDISFGCRENEWSKPFIPENIAEGTWEIVERGKVCSEQEHFCSFSPRHRKMSPEGTIREPAYDSTVKKINRCMSFEGGGICIGERGTEPRLPLGRGENGEKNRGKSDTDETYDDVPARIRVLE